MYRRELALICILIQEAHVKKFFSKRAFLHILNVYSHTTLNILVLVWSLQLSNFGLNHVTEHFSVTIDCVRFLIRRFPLYTYSMVFINQLCITPATHQKLKVNITKITRLNAHLKIQSLWLCLKFIDFCIS